MQNDWDVVKRGWDAQVLGEAPYKFKNAVEAVKTLRAETKANDTPVETPIEKGKGKAADDTMEDDEDDSESGEVSRASLR